MNNLSQKVLKEISDKKITIKPKWKFVLKNTLIWTTSIVCLVLSSLAVSIVIYLLNNNDWDLRSRLAAGPLVFIIRSLPYFWLIFLIILIILIYTNFKKTKKGYKYKLEIIILISILSSILLGFVFYGIGLAQNIEESLTQRVSIYRRFLNPRARMWNQPRQGFLGGRIFMLNPEGDFRIRDFSDQEWKIIGDDIFMPGRIMLNTGTQIKIIGDPIDSNLFKAREIRPWGPPPPGPGPDFIKPPFFRR